MIENLKRDLKVVVFQESGGWIAQCIEYDIAVQGKNLEQLHRRLIVALEQEAKFTMEEYGAEFKGIGPAPLKFLEMYEAARERLDAELDIRIAA